MNIHRLIMFLFYLLAVPSAPEVPSVNEIFKDSCVITWRAPLSDGGTPVTGYFIERHTKSSPSWYRINTSPMSDTSYKCPDLIEGIEYEFRIIAVNKMGASQPSLPCRQFVARDPWEKPGQPGQVKISEVTRRSCRLAWSPPINDGGSPITNYVIEYREAGLYKWTRANEVETVPGTSYTVRFLEAETEYEFRVSAVNKAGAGAASECTLPIKTTDPVGTSNSL